MISMVLRGAVVVFVCVALVSYIAYLRTGHWWIIRLPDVRIPFVMDKPELTPLEPIQEPAFKWRKNGRWVYGDNPPAGVKAIPLQEKVE